MTTRANGKKQASFMNVRRDILYLYEEEHLSERDIANRLGIGASTVHYWIVRQGQKATQKGRPRVTNVETDHRIFDTCLSNPFLSAVDIRRDVVPACSIDTVRNRLKQHGFKCRQPARKPFMTLWHRQQRFRFAISHLHWSPDEWKRVVFSDEKIFRSSCSGALRVYRPEQSNRYDDAYLSTSSVQETGKRFTIGVWMAFGGDGKVKEVHLITDKTLKTEYYLKKILPSIETQLAQDDDYDADVNRLIFMQDMSPIHMSHKSLSWLGEHNIRVLDDWPPKGPDMNPVENVWAELVRRIELKRRHTSVDTKQGLWEDVFQIFHSLPDDYFKNLVNSMVRRVRTVSRERGGWSKY